MNIKKPWFVISSLFLLCACAPSVSSSNTSSPAKETSSSQKHLSPSSSEIPPSSEIPASSSEIEKINPTISIALEDGTLFDLHSFQEPAIEVTPSSLPYRVTYTKDGVDLEGVPTEVGDYAIRVDIDEGDTYHAASSFRTFRLRKIPTLSLSYTLNNETRKMENGLTFFTDAQPVFICEATYQGEPIQDNFDFHWSYTKDDGATDLGENTPSDPGIYAVNAIHEDDGVYAEAKGWNWYHLKNPLKTVQVAIKVGENEYSENGGCGSFVEGALPTFSYALKDNKGDAITDAKVSTYFTHGDSDTHLTINDLTPSEETYAYHVAIEEDEVYLGLNRWVWFSVTSASKITPNITIVYGENKMSENSGGASFTLGSIPDFSYEITDSEGKTITDATVRGEYWTEGGTVLSGKEAITTAGTYSYHVIVEDSARYNALNRWYWFRVTE